MVKINYSMTPQETHYYCIPSVIQAIMRRHGEEMSQSDIARQIGCASQGIPISTLEPFFNSKNLQFEHYLYNEVRWGDPEIMIEDSFEKNKDIIIGYEINNFRHVWLGVDFSSSALGVLDPKDGREYEVNLRELDRAMWLKKVGEFGLVSKI